MRRALTILSCILICFYAGTSGGWPNTIWLAEKTVAAGGYSPIGEDFESGNWCCYGEDGAVCGAEAGNDDDVCTAAPYTGTIFVGWMDNVHAWADEVATHSTTGSKSLAITKDVTASNNGQVGELLAGAMSNGETVQVAACVYLDSGHTAPIADTDICRAVGWGDDQRIWNGLTFSSDSGTDEWGVHVYDDGTQTDCERTLAGDLGSWLEINVISTVNSGAAGSIDIYFDGVKDDDCSVSSVETELPDASDLIGVGIGTGATTGCAGVYTAWFDQVSVKCTDCTDSTDITTRIDLDCTGS